MYVYNDINIQPRESVSGQAFVTRKITMALSKKINADQLKLTLYLAILKKVKDFIQSICVRHDSRRFKVM
jgi:GDP-D-mannose dehydratase